MTTLNPEPGPARDPAAGPGPEPATRVPGWPVQDAGSPHPDPAVDALLERLGGLAELPVSGHGEIYAALHDDLMEALNEHTPGPNDAAGDS